MKEIEIIIEPNGEISIDLIGFKGKDCSKVAQKLAEGLGKIKETKLKNDFWEQEVNPKQKIRRGN